MQIAHAAAATTAQINPSLSAEGCEILGEILETAEWEGKTFTADALAHVQPLHFKHVIVNGIYDFSGTAQPKH